MPAPPRVDTRAAAQRVVPVAREQGIFASSSVQGVVAGRAAEIIRVPSSGQRVMVVASGTATGRVLQAR